MVPFSIMKKLLYIRETKYNYVIDEDGYGHAIIDGVKIQFYVNEYGEIVTDSIKYDEE